MEINYKILFYYVFFKTIKKTNFFKKYKHKINKITVFACIFYPFVTS